MNRISTPELLVKHLYNETNEQESISVNEAIANDVTIKEEFKQLQSVKQALDEDGGDFPGASVVNNIIAFSQKQELAESH